MILKSTFDELKWERPIKIIRDMRGLESLTRDHIALLALFENSVLETKNHRIMPYSFRAFGRKRFNDGDNPSIEYCWSKLFQASNSIPTIFPVSIIGNQTYNLNMMRDTTDLGYDVLDIVYELTYESNVCPVIKKGSFHLEVGRVNPEEFLKDYDDVNNAQDHLDRLIEKIEISREQKMKEQRRMKEQEIRKLIND